MAIGLLAGQAQQRGAQLAVFSELCLCGYPPQDLLERPAFIERNAKELKELAEQNKKADPKGTEQLKEAANKVNDANMKTAKDIINQRVNAFGVSEAEVQQEGSKRKRQKRLQ